MTLILKRSELAKDFITGSQENVGVRVPAHPVALELLGEFEKLGGLGIAAPSANRFGAVSPTTASAVKEEIGNLLSEEDFILNGGACMVGVESTIIDLTQSTPAILRPGGITLDAIEKSLEIKVDFLKRGVKAPGLFKSHYSPKASVVLGGIARPGDGFIALEAVPTPRGAIRLASPATIENFAMEIYEALRLGDRKSIENIIVVTKNKDKVFLFMTPDYLLNIEKKTITFGAPFKLSERFLDPELKKITTLPAKAHYKSIYYSLGSLALHCLFSDSDSDEADHERKLEQIKFTKVYWDVLRCFDKEPDKRSVFNL
jgi:hypothetical protein